MFCENDSLPYITEIDTLIIPPNFYKDIYCAIKSNEDFEKAIRLNDTINGFWEGDVIISPKEDYMIFASYGRPTGSGLYITFNKNEQWTIPQRMDEDINKTGREFFPILSPDEEYFFFTSAYTPLELGSEEGLTYKKIKEDFIHSYEYPQKGKTDIYWVSSNIIEAYRN